MGTQRKGSGFPGILFISVIVVLCNTKTAFSQHHILTEDFSDTDLQTGTKWTGNLSHFEGFADSTGNVWLRLNDESKSGESILSTQSHVAYGRWSFTVNLDFKPSSSNLFLIQLTGDRPDITNGGNGYGLVVGENGDGDTWRLFRYESGVITSKILSGSRNMSNGGMSHVEVTRDIDGKWTLATSADRNSSPDVEATGTDNVLQNSEYFGFKFLYTSTRADKFYLDDISIDALPAYLTGTNVSSGEQIRVSYSLPVASGLVRQDDIILDNILHPENTTVDDQGRLVVQFNHAISPGIHLLGLQNLKDSYGFDIPDTTVKIIWPYHAVEGDLVISEFMYDPPSGLPEYVELANTSEFDIDINGWILEDSSNEYIIQGSGLIAPGSYLVLTPDSAGLSETFGRADYQLQTNWPVLNNGGDQIVLRDTSGVMIDSLLYTSDWGGRGVSLERKSFLVPGYYHWNWSGSLNLDGGTPGRANSIMSDTIKPRIKSLVVPDEHHIDIVWSEDVRDTSAINPRHYQFDKNLNIGNITRMADSTFQISVNTGLVTNSDYRLSVSGVVDWYGNMMAPFDTTISYYKIVDADSGQVVITEFMYDPPESWPEYVELYNRGPDAVDLANWRLSDSNNQEAVVSDFQRILPPDQYIILTSDAIPVWGNIREVVMHSRFPNLNNSGDQIKIYNRNEVLMDSLQYSRESGGGGVSLERRSVNVPAWISSNWGDSPASGGGTPGRQNKIGPDRTAPKIMSFSTNNAGDRITISTDEEILSSKTTRPQFKLTPALKIKSNVLTQREMIIRLAEIMKPANRYTMTISDLSDYFGNSTDTTITFRFLPDRTPPALLIASYNSKMDSVHMIFNETIANITGTKISVNGQLIESGGIIPMDSSGLSFPVSWNTQKKSSGDDQILVKGLSDRWGNTIKPLKMPISRPWTNERLVVNEIMYDPIADAHDGRPDQSEYIELYNNSNVSLSLSGLSIHGEPDENGNFRILRSDESDHAWAPPHAYVVYYADTATSFRASRLYNFFKPDSVAAHFYRIRRMSLNLSANGDAVYLTDNTTVVDSVEYSNAWQNPELVDTRGRSLERITIDGPSNSKSNWNSCASDSGGTPGKINSVFEKPVATDKNPQNQLDITPNPFSPDGDGFHDNLLLAYHLTTSGYRLRVRIFDRYGRLIRTLVNGKIAGSAGTLIWDGLDDRGRRNRIGIYVILFEAYGSMNSPDREFKKTVVLARHL
ncbi:MAG TPA: lamin tail domain-containing protein [Balneolales bacterium]|nr:lamin tail domain-containing protein [Balneolales bacterium]